MNDHSDETTRAWIAREKAKRAWCEVAQEWERAYEEPIDPGETENKALEEAAFAQLRMEGAARERTKWFGLFDSPEKQEEYRKAKEEYDSKFRIWRLTQEGIEAKRAARLAAGRRAEIAWKAYLEAEGAWQRLNERRRGTNGWAREILGVSEDSSPQEIKNAYRQAAKLCHPDYAKRNGLAVEEATALFRNVQEAYEVLCPRGN